jgi:hypothetical protein
LSIQELQEVVMFDYRVSKQPHFDTACTAFVRKHNVAELAKEMGIGSKEKLNI